MRYATVIDFFYGREGFEEREAEGGGGGSLQRAGAECRVLSKCTSCFHCLFISQKEKVEDVKQAKGNVEQNMEVVASESQVRICW